MQVRPEYKSFGELFSENNVFITPKYQRDYSWESEQIFQFMDDIKNALFPKNEGQSPEHFFGGIVCAQEEGVGNRKIINTLVDGQQRLSTIVIFFSILKEVITKLNCINEEDNKYKQGLLKDIYKYIKFDERVHRETVSHSRIKIGKADDDFFQSTIDSVKLEIKRDSHKLIWQAREFFIEFINDDLLSGKNISESLELLDEIIKLFDEKFLLIHIISTSVDEAYKLFMVLNDRGINLTEGELLKAHTIGNYLENCPEVAQMAEDWDLILANDPKNVSDYLRWIITMISGEHISNTKILEKYKASYLNDDMSVSEMACRVRFIREACDTLKLIGDAEWPFPNSNVTTQFHKTKLDWLVKKLKHTHSMPLLLAATYSSETNFQQVISETCKFFIRYKVICNLHASVFSTLYPETARNIFEARKRFRIINLQSKYRDITLKDTNDEKFKAAIRGLTYSRRGDNRPIKYLLVTIQENWKWLTSLPIKPINKRYKLEDRTVVFDFNNTTLEHLYPYSAREVDTIDEMENLKNKVGNLVLLDPNTNESNNDKPFSEKATSFANTGIGIHELVETERDWSTSQYDTLENRYIELAIRAFSF